MDTSRGQDDNTGALQSDAWRQSIEDNYALYGIDVQFLPRRQTQTIDFDTAPYIYPSGVTGPVSTMSRVRPPVTVDDIYDVREAYSNSSAGSNGDDSLYMFVADVADDSDTGLLDGSWGGVRWYSNPLLGSGRDNTEWIGVFTSGVQSSTSIIPNRLSRNMNRTEEVRTILQKTAVHEIGHVLNMGEDEPAEQGGTEVYSGDGDDPTVEYVKLPVGRNVEEWSVMSSGSEREQYLVTDGTHFAFSIEELTTVSTEDTQVSDG